MIIQEICSVHSCRTAGDNMFVLSFHAPAIAAAARPGHFVNIKVDASCDPLLRRPFSIHRVVGDSVEILFNIVGKGTLILAQKAKGDMIDVLGPLGVPYGIDGGFETALLVSGGLGVAPMPFLTDVLAQKKIPAHNIVGARTKKLLSVDHLPDVHIATDDGSMGFHGSVVACLEHYLHVHPHPAPKIFACGPNRMLEALATFAQSRAIPCEVSLECAMACGIGICQGCPVEMAAGDRTYNLVCKDGPVFDATRINIRSLIGH